MRRAAGQAAGAAAADERLDPVAEAMPRVDVAFLRCGIADGKADGVPACVEDLGRLRRGVTPSLARLPRRSGATGK